MEFLMSDTIAAVATPPGEGGIGVIRVSGPESSRIGRGIIRTSGGKALRLKPRYVHFGVCVDPESGEGIDEVLAVFMPGPRSYTTQDVLEISCHGGPAVLRRVLDVVLSSGARPAEPGEFTRRAFLGGRLDLVQAEAVMDLIRSKTDLSRRTALTQLRGGLSRRINEFRESLLDLLLQLQVRIDFCEDDVPSLADSWKSERVDAVLFELAGILETFRRGRIFREGLRICIIGPPNAGKSTLLNTLAGDDRAIVTPIPGTTRDRIEEMVNVGGVPLVLVDTAGIRESSDPVEVLGIERTLESLGNAEAALLVLDASEETVADLGMIAGKIDPSRTVVIYNKIDAGDCLDRFEVERLLPGASSVSVSLREGINLDQLESAVHSLVFSGSAGSAQDLILSNARHRDALVRSRDYLEHAKESILCGVPDDCITIDIQGALDCLGEITGKVMYEEMIDRIFNGFCIGK